MRRAFLIFTTWLLVIGHLSAALSLRGSCSQTSAPLRPNFTEYGVQTPKNEVVGLYYLRARYLNAANGRFWNADSYEGEFEDPQSLHKYLYANADSVNGCDPSGNVSLVELIESTAIAMKLQVARIAPAITAGGVAVGRLWNAFEQLAERAAYQVLSLYNSAIINSGVRMGNSVIDFTFQIGARIVAIEVKYKLPSSGPALTRLGNQISNMVQWGNGQAVVWSLKEPTLAELRAVQQAAGANFNSVQFVNGVEGLAKWIQFYFAATPD